MSDSAPQKQLLHCVFAGEVTRLDGIEFNDFNALASAAPPSA